MDFLSQMSDQLTLPKLSKRSEVNVALQVAAKLPITSFTSHESQRER